MTFVSASASQGTVTQSDGTLTANLGSLDSGATATVTMIVVPTTAGPVVNTATVSGAEADPVPGNNMATLTTVIDAPSTLGDGPTVIRLRRFGFHRMPTTLVLTFSAALDPVNARESRQLHSYRSTAEPPRHPDRLGSLQPDNTCRHAVTGPPAERP